MFNLFEYHTMYYGLQHHVGLIQHLELLYFIYQNIFSFTNKTVGSNGIKTDNK